VPLHVTVTRRDDRTPGSTKIVSRRRLWAEGQPGRCGSNDEKQPGHFQPPWSMLLITPGNPETFTLACRAYFRVFLVLYSTEIAMKKI
jgi:hypothetical protein